MKILPNTQRFITKHELKELLKELKSKGNQDEETIKYLMKEECKDEKDCSVIKEELFRLNLFPFEVYQLLEHKPKNLLILQLIIDEMEERYDDETLNYIINLFN